MADDTQKEKDVAKGLADEDPMLLARAASADELERLIAAEDLLDKRHQRKKRSARWTLLAQAMVGYVALAGFFANAYQNWNNKRQAEERARSDEERWAKEFKRAQDADKYRAFFETSALATDPTNPDKRLVGYALLKEFVDDSSYNSKATFMLAESLALELRDDRGPGLDEPHRAAVVAIISALSHTSDCRALQRATRSIDKLATRHAHAQDLEEARDVVGIYVVRLVGRAAEVCSAKDLLDVRKPIRDLLTKLPELASLTGKPTPADVDRRIAEILHAQCKVEIDSGMSECADVPRAWKKVCDELTKAKLVDGAGLCAVAP
ncbi:MAG TPA: hypothetical protein VFF06_05090 [Polyangia bacterium]|nr:hypothetical protein [Polyangia bacterium]